MNRTTAALFLGGLLASHSACLHLGPDTSCCRPEPVIVNCPNSTRTQPQFGEHQPSGNQGDVLGAGVQGLGRTIAEGSDTSVARAAPVEVLAYDINRAPSPCTIGAPLHHCDSVDPVHGTSEGASFGSELKRVLVESARILEWMDGDVRPRDWTDRTRAGTSATGMIGRAANWGDDSLQSRGVDSASVALLCGHSTSKSPFLPGTWFDLGEADPHQADSCKVNTLHNLHFGDKLEIAIFATCQSAQRSAFEQTRYATVHDPEGPFTTWLGFHGNSYDSAHDARLFGTFLSLSQTSGLGSNWVDLMRRQQWSESNRRFWDQCPAAVVFCTDSSDGADCDRQYFTAGFTNRDTVGAGLKAAAKYYGDPSCVPKEGD